MAAFARRMLAGDICKEALALQGLPVPSAISTNTNDTTSRQIWAQLRAAGRRLCKPTKTHRWQALTRTWELTTVPGKTRYDLPADHDSFQDLTGWSLTSMMPMLGPVIGAQWACLRAHTLGSSTISVLYRIVGDKLELYNDYPSPQSLLIDYTSRGWVQLVSSPDPANPLYADQPQEDGDKVMLDPEMMVCAVQYGFMSAKGFDTTAISAMLDKLIESAIDGDSDAPMLQVVGSDSYPLLSIGNLPETGYGS